MSEKTSKEPVSKSKLKRLKMQNDLKYQRQKRVIKILWLILIPVVLLSLTVFTIFYLRSKKIDYGKYLNDDGTIADINIDDYVSDNTKMMCFDKINLLPDNETIDNDIDSMLKERGVLETDNKRVILLGDTINISYESYLDNEPYASVDSSTGGADIIITRNQAEPDEYYESFLGKKVGEKFTTTVKYPTDYSVPDLAGKKLKYNITINGIYKYPKFDDEFVLTYYSDQASTAEEYRQIIVDGYYKDNLEDAIEASLSTNCIVNSVPDSYVSKVEKIFDKQYSNYAIEYGITNYELVGVEDEAAYETTLHESAAEYTKQMLMYQAIFEHNELTNDIDTAHKYLIASGYSEEGFRDAVSLYGEKYVTSLVIPDIVMDYLLENVVITE